MEDLIDCGLMCAYIIYVHNIVCGGGVVINIYLCLYPFLQTVRKKNLFFDSNQLFVRLNMSIDDNDSSWISVFNPHLV